MTDIEGRITGFLRDEADHAALPNEMYQRVLRRARIRRLVTATLGGVAMIAIIMTGVMIAGEPRSPANVAPAGPEELPVPPDSLREQVPDELDRWIEPGLVLLYREGRVYHILFEGVVPHHCPIGATERDPELCFSTALHFVWDRDATGDTLDHDLKLPELPDGADVLWQGIPEEGSIGIRSPGACARIERFERYYECRDGVPVYLRENTNTDECPVLLRPGRHARRQAKSAIRRWARTQEQFLQGTSFTGIRVEPAGKSPQWGCESRRIPHRKQTWQRTWVAHLGWEDPGIEGMPRSAHLVHIGVYVGRTPRGWEVYSPNFVGAVE